MIRFRPFIQELVVFFYFSTLRSNLHIPQCVSGTLPHLVVPSVRFDGYESYDRAFSRLQSGMSPTSWSPLCILHANKEVNVRADIEVRPTQFGSHKAKCAQWAKYPQGRSSHMTKYSECALLPVHVVPSSVIGFLWDDLILLITLEP